MSETGPRFGGLFLSEMPKVLPPRIVITGANGSGKTTLARAIAGERPLVHLDTLKLTTGWRQRPRAEVRAALESALSGPDWVVEGGPSLLLPTVLDHAGLVIWLDLPVWHRAALLARRVAGARGQVRPELPPGNVDHAGQQLRFAVRSLWHHRAFRRAVLDALDGRNAPAVLRVTRIGQLRRAG